jgi:hypothetical protein
MKNIAVHDLHQRESEAEAALQVADAMLITRDAKSV